MQAQALAVAGAPARELGAAVLAVSGEGFGVDGVGFAERSKRADEGLDLAGVGSVGRNAVGEQGGQQIAFIAARGLADDEAGRVEPAAKSERPGARWRSCSVRPLAVSKTTIVVLPTSHPMKREGVAGGDICGYPP